MHNPEETRLREYMDHVRSEAEQVTDEKLEEAVRHGMVRGKRTKQRKRGLVAAIALAAAIWMLWAGLGPSPKLAEQHRLPGPYPALAMDFTRYPHLQQYSELGLIQHAGQSAEAGGYSLTVVGVITGTHMIKVIYTVEHDFSKQAVVMNTAMKNALSDEPVLNSSFIGGGELVPRGSHMFEVSFVLPLSQNFPESLVFEAVLAPDSPEARYGGEVSNAFTLQIPLKLDLEAVLKLTHIIPLEHSVEAGGQQVTIREAVLSATGAVIHTTEGSQNTSNGVELERMSLEIVEGSGAVSSLTSMFAAGPDDEGSKSYYFEDPRLLQARSITLTAQGLSVPAALRPKLIVDLEKGQMEPVRTEYGRMTYSGYRSNEHVNGEKVYTLTFEYESQQEPRGLYVDYIFKDGTGKAYDVVGTAISRSYSGSNGNEYPVTTFEVHIEPQAYKGPLVLELGGQTQVMKQPMELPIR
ncbi:hypothetical protein JJQ72_18140 [Paenibacillus sp. F411]|uniref:hypothetical protein n=1 Tax=Paenibacillus sp. F411 TaxID=2820239 RepID=UPI001AAF2827|nr:hypothetical protein [Paenibacillus sp. F411]MBO2945904.1 hypothetical protein [Paenibacillus sp. F411]